jgi:SAM-dependent methyltransferase
MDDLSAEEMEAIARSYQELLVPAMFEDCAARILDMARPRPGDRVLDVACGTGVLARAAANRMGQGGSVVGLDMNPGMLSVAEKLAPELDWRQGRAEDLPLDDGTFDLVACQLSLMFFEDRKATIREMLRVLKPDGRLVVTVFGSLESIPPYERMIEVYDAVSDGQVGEFLSAPFALSDTDELRTLFADGGLTPPHVFTQELDASFPNVRTFVLADVKGWFPLAGIELDENQIEEVVRRARSALEDYIGDEGRVTFGMPVHFVANVEEGA